MFIDCSKLPNPADPQVDDVYTSPGSTHVLVVTSAPYRDEDYYMRVVRDGVTLCLQAFDFPAILTSLALRPWGRLDRSSADGRPKITVDPQLVEQRLEGFGPHLRALREQYGLSTGDLGRALGCPLARLSMLELGEPDPVREGAGVREDEGRAALAELLAETVRRVYVIHRGEGSDAFQADVWQEVHGMLVTAPAHAAMSTIISASSEAQAATSPGTGAWNASQFDPERAAQYVLTWLDNEGLMEPSQRLALLAALTTHLTRLKAKFKPSASAETVFRPDDRIIYNGKAATVREVDHEASAMLVTFESGETSAVPMTDVQLANENVAIETARAGLAHLLTTELLKIPAHLSSVDPQEFQSVIEGHLASDKAQRLIRLHG